MVIPTVRVEGPLVMQGADPFAQSVRERSAGVCSMTDNMDLEQLLSMIGDLGKLTTEEKTNLVAAVNELALKADAIDADEVRRIIAEYAEENPAEEADPTVPDWAKATTKPGYTATEVGAVATVNGVAPDENGNVEIQTGNGLTTEQIHALNGMFKVCAFVKDDVSAEYTTFKTAFGIVEEEPEEPVVPEVTLSSISATYSGGDVAVGTALTDLTGIVVTAHYSDGISETVTGYTLSGTIAEGANTVTVSYGGMTATFTVTGVAESGDDTGDNGSGWTDGVPYDLTLIENEYPDKTNGAIITYNGWTRTDYTPCHGVSVLRPSVFTDIYNNGSNDNAFYDENKNYVGTFTLSHLGYDISVPADAYYFIASHRADVMESLTITPIA